jgi:hypothetical protein
MNYINEGVNPVPSISMAIEERMAGFLICSPWISEELFRRDQPEF